MAMKYIIRITVIICTAAMLGCHFESVNPDCSYLPDTELPATEEELEINVITESGSNLAYHGDVLLIDFNTDKVTEAVTIHLIDDIDQTTTIAEDYTGTFPFSWIIPDDFPICESYRISVTGSYYKNGTEIYGRSDEFAILADFDSGLTDITVSSRSIEITLTDNGSVIDGDTISISLNGSVLDANHILAEAPGTTMSLELLQGINTLSITAVNEGSVSPNTAEITFTDVSEGEAVQQWRLLEGETGALSISAP